MKRAMPRWFYLLLIFAVLAPVLVLLKLPPVLVFVVALFLKETHLAKAGLPVLQQATAD